jgi:SNF2 family DNA or RNA helicase
MAGYEELYKYQKRGVDYLVEHGGGFLWDEPGLGKTRQAIVAAKRIGGPVLVVCPNALKSWWREEIKEVYPGDKVLVAGVGGRFYKGRDQDHLIDHASKFPFWVVVHYTGLRINTEELKQVQWRTVVTDECHYIKNRKAQRSKAVMEVTSPLAARIGLTATPFGKNPADMWHQLRWMVPTSVALRSYWKFYNVFVDYEVERRGSAVYRKVKGGKNLEQLAQIMAGFGLQRTKKVVAPDLPPLTDTFLPLDFEEGMQYSAYEKLRKSEAEAQLGEDTIVIPNALARLIRMEQLLSHPWTMIDGMKGVKYDWLMEWAESYRHQAVIATHFKSSAHRLAKDLGSRTAITGDIPTVLRDSVLKRWRSGDEQFLVGTIATIGTGLNLQEAHAMVCYDQVYNPIYMEQLKHRIHRVNTDHPVQIIYPYAVGTTNEVIKDSFSLRLEQMEFVKRFVEHLTGDNNDD